MPIDLERKKATDTLLQIKLIHLNINENFRCDASCELSAVCDWNGAGCQATALERGGGGGKRPWPQQQHSLDDRVPRVPGVHGAAHTAVQARPSRLQQLPCAAGQLSDLQVQVHRPTKSGPRTDRGDDQVPVQARQL